jgi:DNA-directed RNA polymerase specialized sigma24 family protein
MRVALHWSLCADDAHDAFQRAIEIYMRRIESLDQTTELAWLKVVVKHEALAVRRARAELLPNDDLDAGDAVPDPHRPIDDLLDGRERVSRSAEALRRIKPDEARALMLKANGLSYEEIASELGWTYTKVNRCITEGRARFLRLYEEIEAGESCERFAPTLASLVAGTASAEALLELRPHIRNCSACRATIRDLHTTRLGRLAALWPIPALVAPLRWVTGRGAVEVTDVEAKGVERIGELTPTDVPDLYQALSSADALPAASSGRWLELKAQVYGWIHRLQGTDIVATAQVTAGAGGGGRIATIGAIVGLCLSSVGAGTVCVVTGIVPNPLATLGRPEAPHDPRSAKKPPARDHAAAVPRREPKRALATPTPTATPKRQPVAERKTRKGDSAEAPASTPTSHEQPPPSPVATGAPADFTFEGPAQTGPRQPSAQPATGGGEFAP